MTKNTKDFPNQDKFLEDLVKSKAEILLFLINGVKLEGSIISSDNFCIFLARNNNVQLVYKHAIATIFLRNGNGSLRVLDGRINRN